MGAKLTLGFTTGLNLYMRQFNTSAQIWNTAGTPAFEAITSGNVTDYDIAGTEATGSTGVYVFTVPSTTPAGELTHRFYVRAGGSPAWADVEIGAAGTTWDGSAITSGSSSGDAYQARVWPVIDTTNSQDEYTCIWFKNAAPVTSGITSPTIQVIKYADGTDLIAETAMTEIGSSQTFKYVASSGERLSAGEGGVAIVTATIDGATRTHEEPVGRDS